MSISGLSSDPSQELKQGLESENTARIELHQELITYYIKYHTIDGIDSVIRKVIIITKSTFKSTSRLLILLTCEHFEQRDKTIPLLYVL